MKDTDRAHTTSFFFLFSVTQEPVLFGKKRSYWGVQDSKERCVKMLNRTMSNGQSLLLSGHPACYRLILQGRGPFAYVRRCR